MKYLVLIPDGMADVSVEALGNMTPMQKANKPTMDALAKNALIGTVSNVPEGMVPESDTANMAILSFDPKIFSKGRSPLEAVSMGIEMQPDETAYRCNVVTLTEEQDCYEDRIILDHSADEITTAEADLLIKTLEEKMGNELRKFYTGVSYRHCLIWKNGNDRYNFMRPHDILGKRIGEYLPRVEDGGEEFLKLMKESYDILKDHPEALHVYVFADVPYRAERIVRRYGESEKSPEQRLAVPGSAHGSCLHTRLHSFRIYECAIATPAKERLQPQASTRQRRSKFFG